MSRSNSQCNASVSREDGVPGATRVRVQAGPRPAKRKTEAAMYVHEPVMKARQDQLPCAAARNAKPGSLWSDDGRERATGRGSHRPAPAARQSNTLYSELEQLLVSRERRLGGSIPLCRGR